MDEQRLGAFSVSGELMRCHLFRPTPAGQWFRIDAGIPADAEFVRCYEDFPLNQFVFIYRHPSFPIHRPGERVQFLDPPQITALVGVRIDRGTGQLVVQSSHPKGVRVAQTSEEFFADAPTTVPFADESRDLRWKVADRVIKAGDWFVAMRNGSPEVRVGQAGGKFVVLPADECEYAEGDTAPHVVEGK